MLYALRVRASLSLRTQQTQKISFLFYTAPPQTPPPQGEKIWQGNFWFASPLRPPKSSVSIPVRYRGLSTPLLSSSWRPEALRVYRASGGFSVRSHTPAPPHSSLTG